MRVSVCYAYSPTEFYIQYTALLKQLALHYSPKTVSGIEQRYYKYYQPVFAYNMSTTGISRQCQVALPAVNQAKVYGVFVLCAVIFNLYSWFTMHS
jgi:hypothetical protein